MKVVVLGGSGMLGSMLVDYLSKYYQVIATVRNKRYTKPIPNVKWVEFNYPAWSQEVTRLISDLKGARWVINAIGMIPQRAEYGSIMGCINTGLPHLLAALAKQSKYQVIHITTDCVYSGRGGHYKETDVHDSVDNYGMTKSKGEVVNTSVINLRCSLIGTEPYRHTSLLGWFLDQPEGLVIEGYANHLWNGITSLHFARICRGLIDNKCVGNAGLQHIVPADAVSKAKLLMMFREYLNRQDIIIKPVVNRRRINRILDTAFPDWNNKLWQMAGYPEPPTIRQMVKELAEYVKEGE